MFQYEYDVIVRNKRLRVLLIILTTLMVAVVLCATIKVGREYISESTETLTQDMDTTGKSSLEPERIDFGTDLPTGFPGDLPIEEGATLTQSYSLDYPEQRQLSIVFSSVETVEKNYDFYRDILARRGWNVVVTHEDKNASLLQGAKEESNIIISIDESTELPSIQSQVTMNVFLKKNPSNIGGTDQSSEVKIPDEDIVVQEIREFSGEEAKKFLEGDSPEAEYFRSVKDLSL